MTRSKRSSERFVTSAPEDEWLLEDLYYEKAAILDALDRAEEAMAPSNPGCSAAPSRRCSTPASSRCAASAVRRTFTVLPGGRR